jgi:NADPH-dependent 2,4-dienoyl-CoA reductase/sulfur reductase-like enzyme
MRNSKYLILGGGMVAGYCAKGLVERGLQPGELTIVSEDNSLPYERPPLSKGFLAGKDSEESIRINAEEFYRKHEIDLRLASSVVAVDAGRRLLRLGSGDDLEFEKLVIATGAEVSTLQIQGSGLRGLHYLRSLDDSKRIRAHAANARRAAVIGGGFIAMEVAAVLAQRGVETTMILREDRIAKRVFTPEMSRFFENYYSARGVRLVKEATVTAFRGKDAVESVTVADQSIGCDLVVAGIGVRPVTGPLARSGLQLGDGVLVNEYLETNIAGIYAAGDVANYQDSLFNTRRRVEHWDNAVSQGQHCARLLTGERASFNHVPYFFSDVFDLSYEFWGDPANAGEIVERGDLSTPSFSVWWLSQERLVAAFTLNRSDEEREAAQRWIAAKTRISAEKLRAAGSVIDSELPSALKAG